MTRKKIHTLSAALIVVFALAMQPVNAQFKVQGTVYDSSRLYPLESVTVLSTAGKGALTDANGKYTIDVAEKDSIWFSYLGKPTIKFAVLKMNDPLHFDVSVHINVMLLRGVTVTPRNYRLDSLQNRLDYAKIFNYEKPKLRPTLGSGVGVGFDLDEIIRMFQFRKNKNMQLFQQRLLEQEKDKFIDHRFNKQLVRRLTALTGEQLDSFMVIYRPNYEITLLTTDYEFQSYIKNCYEQFKAMDARKEKSF